MGLGGLLDEDVPNLAARMQSNDQIIAVDIQWLSKRIQATKRYASISGQTAGGIQVRRFSFDPNGLGVPSLGREACEMTASSGDIHDPGDILREGSGDGKDTAQLLPFSS